MRLNTQRAQAVDFNFQRLIVCCADKVCTGRRPTISAKLQPLATDAAQVLVCGELRESERRQSAATAYSCWGARRS